MGVYVYMQDTYDIWQEAIAYCKPGRHYKGIGGVIEDLCTAKGYTTVPNFCESQQPRIVFGTNAARTNSFVGLLESGLERLVGRHHRQSRVKTTSLWQNGELGAAHAKM